MEKSIRPVAADRIGEQKIDNAQPAKEAQLAAAHRYNEALASGALLEANQRKAKGVGDIGAAHALRSDIWDYLDILSLGNHGLMARLKIESADIDLPVYHTSGDDVLEKGAGHLQGTSFPVGGIGTRAVITAHRGLANATMFTNLDKMRIGDDIVIEVFGEVLVYRTVETKIVNPDDTESIKADPDRDLLTLVTCTPLGINSHRILVTGERIYPTPQADLDNAGKPSELPRFPWWAVEIAVVLIFLAWWLARGVKAYRKQKTAAQELSQ
ncbi:class C sortase [Arcanobacterium hippocoleae]|uniref:class C sortase n=1 Tax=Arcanobacterium hippocoleae TaxID=149017 RepID=UPI0033403E2D